MEEKKSRDVKQDIICIWKEFPYLGDVRDPSILNIFANYKIYENQIRLMAQMRIILMSEYSYKDIKPYISSIKDDDDTIYEFVTDATNIYEEELRLKNPSKRRKLEDYTDSIRKCMIKNKLNSDEMLKYNGNTWQR